MESGKGPIVWTVGLSPFWGNRPTAVYSTDLAMCFQWCSTLSKSVPVYQHLCPNWVLWSGDQYLCIFQYQLLCAS